jgi:predicted DNA-binding ribbon-helix-helix protein
VYVGTRKTSVSVEAPFWEALKEIATAQNRSRNKLITRINQERQHANLSSEVRLFVLDHYRQLAEAQAVEKADAHD